MLIRCVSRIECDMDIRQLKNFLAVCEEMGVGRAAQRVNLSQTALSRQIQALEAELGFTLFDRSSKAIRLTAAGRHYEQEVRIILDALGNSARTAREIASGHHGELKIGIFGSAILDFIPATLHRFSTDHPQVRINLISMHKDDQIEALRRRTLDLGFNRLVPDEPDICVELVRTEPLVVAMSCTNSLVAADEVSLSSLADHPLILYPSGVRNSLIAKVHAMFADEGVTQIIAHEVADLISALALVSAGFGISIVPMAASRIRLNNIEFRRLTALRQSPVINLACLYRREDTSPLVSRMIGCVREMARTMPSIEFPEK